MKAKEVFKKHPEADMFVYGPPGSGVDGAGVVWLKRVAALDNGVSDLGQIACFRTDRLPAEDDEEQQSNEEQQEYDEQAWEVLPNTTTSFKAMMVGAECITEADLKDNRRRCIDGGFGGFAFKKAHFDQFG